MSIAQAFRNFFRFLSGSNQSYVTHRVRHGSSTYSDSEQVELARQEQSKKLIANRAAREAAAREAAVREAEAKKQAEDNPLTRIQLL